MDKTLIVNAMIFNGSGAVPFSGDVLVERIRNLNALRRRAPWLGSRHRDITCQTRTLAAPGADATAFRKDGALGGDA